MCLLLCCKGGSDARLKAILFCQVQLSGRHLVVWDHHTGAGARACALCALPAHEGVADDHPEPAALPGVRRQEALLQGQPFRPFLSVKTKENQYVLFPLQLKQLCVRTDVDM